MKYHRFIDIHTHGFGRYDTRTANPEDILKMAELHGKAGTAAILPTVYSGSIGEMRTNMEAVKKAMAIQKKSGFTLSPHSPLALRPLLPSVILGVHLEGPFLNPARCGALDRSSFIKPSVSSLKKLIDGYEEIVRIVTVAPEMPGALKVIGKSAEIGSVVSMGHSDATYREALNGKSAGARGITHLFNAMRPFHHREPGLSGFGLLDEDIYVEVIADGVHLHRETLKLIFSVKRHDRIIVVSDSIRGAKSGGRPIFTREGTLAGSGAAIADSAGLLRKIGLTSKVIMEAGRGNPERLLTKKMISGNLNFPLRPPD